MQNLSAIAKSVRTTVSKRSPEILTALGITGMLTTTVLAVKATPKACKRIEEERNNRGIIFRRLLLEPLPWHVLFVRIP